MGRILLVNNGYPSRTNPNYVTYIQSMESCLKYAGHEVDLLVLDSNFTSWFGKYRMYLKYYWNILWFNRFASYDYVYVNNYPYSFMPLVPHLRRIKQFVIHWHGDDIFPRTFFSGILNFFSYKFIPRNTLHLAPSHYFAKAAAQKLAIDEDRVKISPSGGIDTRLFKPIPVDITRDQTSMVRLGFASGLLKSKGMDLVVSIMERRTEIEQRCNCKIEFHFIDYGKEREHYKTRLSKIPGMVCHKPFRRELMVEFYNQFDILLFPSVREAEALGLVALEAMACNIPVVSTDDFALGETVKAGQTGERFEKNSISAFIKAVEKCIMSLSNYSPREFVEAHYSQQIVARDYRSILHARRILLMNNGYPSRTNPNYVTYIQSMEACLKNAGLEVDLLVLDSNFTTWLGKYLMYLKYYWKILHFNRFDSYDCVYVNNYPYSFMPLVPHLRRIKQFVIHWHGDDIFPGTLFSRILNYFSYKFIPRNTLHLAPSHYFAKAAAQKLAINEDRVKVSPSGGIDTRLFKPIPMNTIHDQTRVVRLGFASGLLKSKGMDLVVSILVRRAEIEQRCNCKIEFHFIDYGKEREHYKAMLNKIPGMVCHKPFPRESMVKFYNLVHIVLFPSRAESLGLVALEAMACNVPVVSTDDFAFVETVKEGQTGERFEKNSINAFMEAVEKCIMSLSNYSAREFVEAHYSQQIVARGYQAILP